MAKAELAERPSALGTLGAWLREIAIVVIGALVASTLLRLFIVQMFVIPSQSMENTLLINDRVAVQKVAGFQRGDVVVFRDARGWLNTTPHKVDALHEALIFLGLAPDESAEHLIKRVIGVAGDHVVCCDARGRLSVNGVALDEREYLYTDPSTGQQVEPSANAFDVVVPAGTIFVMGDHRNASQDSRCHLGEPTNGLPEGSMAFIPTDAVVGVAVAVVFPLNRIHGISRPHSFENVPPGGTPPAAPVITGDRVVC